MKKCVLCKHAVGGGGDRHGKYACPPPALGRDSQRSKRKRKARRRSRKDAALLPIRGVTVAGTGVPKGAQKG